MTASSTLAGHTALVTGASRGIGRAIAQRLAAQGAAVVVTASARSAAGLDETVARITAAGGRATAVVCDLADPSARETLVTRATAALGAVDILVNNAATIGAYAPPSRIDATARRALWEVNVEAPLVLAQQALPAMRAAGWGRVLNIGSETAEAPPAPYPGPAKFVHALAAYGASKAALRRLTTGLAAELQGSGITVNELRPYKICRSESAEAVAAQMAATHPDWVEPVECMAEAALTLITRGVTGRTVHSRAWLSEIGQPIHALDGVTVLGGALDT